MAARAGVVLAVALEFVDEVAGLPDAQFVGCLEAEPVPQQAHEVDLPPATNGPNRPDLRSRGRTGAGLIRELWGREPVDGGSLDSRACTHLDDFLRLAGIALGFSGQPADLVLDGLLALPVGPLHDDLEACSVTEQGRVEFRFDMARGRRTGEVGQADFP